MHVNELAEYQRKNIQHSNLILSQIDFNPRLQLASLGAAVESMTAVESSTVLSVALLAVMALIIAPLLFAMIFKSERKQAKFTYQYAKA